MADTGRTALVTGGTRGIGRAICLALQKEGCHVAAVYHAGEESARLFQEQSGIRAFKWNVADFDACKRGVAVAENELGPVDILVNNAGITHDTPLHRMTKEQWTDVLATNLGSMFNMCRPVIEGMRARRFGRIVNVGSVNGQRGQYGQTNYAASKAGIVGFTKSLALESACFGITVNCVAPGYCHTDMVAAVRDDVMTSILATIPVGRLGDPEDIARIVAFLSQESAGFITGATFSANGGQYMA